MHAYMHKPYCDNALEEVNIVKDKCKYIVTADYNVGKKVNILNFHCILFFFAYITVHIYSENLPTKYNSEILF